MFPTLHRRWAWLGSLKLAVGDPVESVTVTQQGEAVNVESADTTGLVTTKQMGEMVVRGRDVMNLLRVLPGVSTIPIGQSGASSDGDTFGSAQSLGGVVQHLRPGHGSSKARLRRRDDDLHHSLRWPGGAGVILGGPGEYEALDYLTPHTTRQRGGGRHWEIAPREIAMLLARYRKPVVDDSPARNGTAQFGGPGDRTFPFDHILQIYQVWQLGAYTHYQHDMFQTGYGTPAVPPSGIPDPEFNPYHQLVLEFIAQRDRYRPAAR